MAAISTAITALAHLHHIADARLALEEVATSADRRRLPGFAVDSGFSTTPRARPTRDRPGCRAVPYGASTAGENRFKPPQPPAPWDGVRDAVEYGNRAPQTQVTAESAGDYGRLIRWYEHPGEMSGGAPVWLYLWTWPSPGMGGKFGAVHGVDVGLAFHNFAGEITGGGTEEGRLMADRLASAWVAFARTGSPNNPQLPEWPAYDVETKPTMVFDAETRVIEDPKKDLRGFWPG